MVHLVYCDNTGKKGTRELDKILSGSKTMLVRGAAGRKGDEVDNKVSFAHQSILDCFLADKMLKRYYDGEDLVAIIGSKAKQTPGKRYQVQMLMQSLSELDSQDFLDAGQRLFAAEQIRYFVKFVFLEVLNQLDTLDATLQNFVLNHCENEVYGRHMIHNVIFSRPHYIRLLRQQGILEQWFHDPQKKGRVFQLLISMSPHYDKEDIAFIENHAFQSPEDDNKFSRCFLHDIHHDTDELFELRMKFYTSYPEMVADVYLDVKSMLKHCEIRTIRFLAFLLANKIKRQGKSIYRYEEELLDEESEIFIDHGVEVVHLLLPCIPTERDESLSLSDWSGRYFHKRGLERACIHILKKANATLIKQNPQRFWELYQEFLGKGLEVFNELILDGLYRLQEDDSDAVINYIGSDLDSNLWDRTSGNEDELFLAKQLLDKHGKSCSEEVFRALEKGIISYWSPDAKHIYQQRIHYNREENGAKVYWSFWGELQKELLEVLPHNRLSSQAKELMGVLNRKFPKGTTLYKHSGVHSGGVSSPVAGKKLSDKQWLGILTNTKLKRRGHSRWKEVPGGFRESSVEAFAGSFNRAVAEEPERMINLVLSHKAEILAPYRDTLFSGVAHSKELDNVPVELLEAMILSFPYDDSSYRADAMCTIIKKRNREQWSRKVLEILKDIAVNHKDPELGKPNVTRREDKEMASYDRLQSNALNCVRGRAARAIEQLLWQDSALFEQFKSTLEKLARDENPAVKLASLFPLWPGYNIEREWASELILNIYEQDYRIAGFYDTKRMLFLLYPHYRERVLKIIQKC